MSKRATTTKPKLPGGKFTDPWVRDVRPPTKEQKQFYYFEKLERGLSISMCHGWAGTKSFRAHTYDANGKTLITKLGVWGEDFCVKDARDAARAVFKNPERCDQEKAIGTFADASERWYTAKIKGKAITATEVRRKLDRYVVPELGHLKFTKIERADVVRFLDTIEAKHGSAQANGCLTTVSAVINWQAERIKGGYQPPLLRKLKRGNAKGRERVLSPEELRKVWNTASTMNTTPAQKSFNGLVRLATLTAQRREKLMTLKWSDIVDGTWTVRRADAREKGTPKKLVLPNLALAVLAEQPKASDYVFPVASMGRYKRLLDKAAGVSGYTIHDLRRTARSIMTGIKGADKRPLIAPHAAEAVLGHALGTQIERIYNRHDWTEEIANALQVLADHLENAILPEPASKGTKLESKAA